MPEFPPPELPQWAAEAGCPAPKSRESFRSYVERLGLNFEELVVGLDGSTTSLANLRLASELHKQNPGSFSRYLERRIKDAQERYSYQCEQAQADRQ